MDDDLALAQAQMARVKQSAAGKAQKQPLVARQGAEQRQGLGAGRGEPIENLLGGG